MNRINQKNQELSQQKRKAFIAYITAGFPTAKATEQLVYTLEENGVDFIELGMPFSDPVADGPTIQAASCAALAAGMNMINFLNLVKTLRQKTQIPLIMMSYYNPIFKYGIKKFAVDAKLAGLDGVIVPDLPPEEAVELNQALNSQGIAQIFIISPVTEPARMQKIAKLSQGFIYYVPLTGVTGARTNLPKNIAQSVKAIKKCSQTPVFVGFGISTGEQVKQVVKISDGVIVGSGIIKVIEQYSQNEQMFKKVGQYIRSLSQMCC
ncbi:MAG: tryptophan synthase subunit alpha [Candidatus Omnitrophica bacterium]|nr:tryptophan synthase subunit alpha [Candidatus Omnitrophota bacterium]